jgi:glyoxylase-like metal-dependent hydrolase (beta-lactamase superfamily II)
MTERLPEYEIFAIRYAMREARRSEHFIGGDPHDGPMPMDYFTWLIVGDKRTYVVDTGFTAEVAAQRNRQFLRCPVETMGMLGIAAADVSDVILTHMHYDHSGNFHKFPNARFHMQEREMAYVTGRYMRYPRFGNSFEVEEVVGMVRLNFQGRVELYDGEVELAPGIALHLTGGHTAGLQIVRVHTRRGWVVLASDAAHYYEHMRTNRLFTTAFHLGHMVDAFRTVERLAASPAHIIPGHDPLVMRQYAPPTPAMQDIVVRLDEAPAEIPELR